MCLPGDSTSSRLVVQVVGAAAMMVPATKMGWTFPLVFLVRFEEDNMSATFGVVSAWFPVVAPSFSSTRIPESKRRRVGSNVASLSFTEASQEVPMVERDGGLRASGIFLARAALWPKQLAKKLKRKAFFRMQVYRIIPNPKVKGISCSTL